jgi:hypothetical protein
MFSNYLGDKVKQYFVENKILNNTWVLELDTGAATCEIKTATILWNQGGIAKTAVATGAIAIAGENTIEAQGANTTCYYVITLDSDSTLKLYKGTDDLDAFPDLLDAMTDGQIPLMVLKAVSTAAWTALTDNWNDADITVTGCKVQGVIPGAKPSELTYAAVVA